MNSRQLGKKLRSEFPILQTHENGKRLIYLDSAASAQKPKAVIRAMSHNLTHDYANVHRGSYALSAYSTSLYEEARVHVANFLGKSVKPHQVIFTRGTTESLNLLAWGFSQTKLTKSSRIVIPITEHHSNLVPWQQAALRKNCELAYIHLNGASLSLNMDEAAKLIRKNTKVVSFAYMGHLIGQINPLKKLIELAKNVNSFVVVDCAQSITCLNDDLFALGADAIVFSSHKIFGPTGIGVLVLKDELAQIFPPMMFGGGMISEMTEEGARWVPPPSKFEAGTPPITEAVGLTAALTWYTKLGGPPKGHTHSAKLAALFLEGLKKLKEFQVFSPDTGQETIIAFRHQHIHSHDIATILDSHDIAVRAGRHCAWPLVNALKVDSLCRASFSIYNDTDDVEKILEVLKKASLF